MKGLLLVVFCLIGPCYTARLCLSCSGIEGSASCTHHVQCAANEVCYTSRYTTESGADNYDFGCSHKQVCPSSSLGAIIGKRAEGRHLMCYECCNNADLCNRNVGCNTATTKPVGNLPRECSDISTVKTSGVHTIYPLGVAERPVKVLCEVSANGGAWTVIQRRINGSVDFYRDWDSYKDGFGSPNGEYWLGNDVIHVLTASHRHELMINMSDFEGEKRYAKYDTITIGDEADGYSLHVVGYSGDAGDGLTYHSGQKFTTHDRDNDQISGGNCAVYFKGAWWFKGCHFSNLNGEYLFGHYDGDDGKGDSLSEHSGQRFSTFDRDNDSVSGNNCAVGHKGAWWFNSCLVSDLNGEYLFGQHDGGYGDGLYWLHFRGRYYSLKSTMMMIRKTSV